MGIIKDFCLFILFLGPFYLIVEYCDNGSLIDYLRKHESAPEYVNTAQSESLSQEWKLRRTLEICNGMEYLAKHKVSVHFKTRSGSCGSHLLD